MHTCMIRLDFVVKNIFKAYFHMSKLEYMIVLSIVIVNATTELIYAIVVGFVLSGALFMWQYSKISIIASVHFGCDYTSKIMRSLLDERLLAHLGKQIMIIRIQSYLFFGSSNQVKTRIQKMVELESSVRYFILDLSQCTGNLYKYIYIYICVCVCVCM